jgi:hypothetical protein
LSPEQRKAYVVHWNKIENVEELAKDIGALVVVLPGVNDTLSHDDVNRWLVVENQLVHSSAINIPVFFCLDSFEVKQVELELSRPTSLDTVELALAGPIEAPFVVKPEIALFEGWLQG